MNYESGLYSDCPAGCQEHEHCDACGRGYEHVYHVPDWMWAKLHERAPAGLLCPCCAVMRAYRVGMQFGIEAVTPKGKEK